jgi:MFS family permease
MKTWDELKLITKEALPLWKNRDFIIICLALFISGIGDGIFKIALLWLSYDLTKSVATMGIVFACLTLPGIFSGFLSGALADRFSKKKIFIVANFMLGIFAAGFVWAHFRESILLVYVLAFFMGTFFAFDGGPFRAYLPEIFPGDKLQKVNAAVSAVYSLTMLIGPALGGIIIAAGNVVPAFLVDAATFFIAAVLMIFLPTTLPRMVEGTIKIRVLLNDIKSGVTYMFHSPVHRFLMLFFISLLGIYYISGGMVTPLCEEILSKTNKMKGSTALAIIQATFGLGGLVSSFFIPKLMRKIGCLRTLIIGALLCVVELFAFGFITNIYFMAVITTLTAASGPLLMVPLFTFIQEKTEPRFMGRAMGTMDTLILVVISFSYGFGGMLGDVLGIIPLFIITGFAILAFTIIIPYLPGYKRVRHLEKLG